MLYRFLDFEIDDFAGQLRRESKLVPVERRVLDVVLYLARSRGRIVTRSELLAEVWKGVHVSDHVVSQAIYSARRVLGDDAKNSRLIETVRGRGIRFATDVEIVSGPNEAGPPLIGRSAELAQLEAQLLDAPGEQTRLVLLRGEPGVGKTRLWSEFARRARASGSPIFVGRCAETPGAPPLWPWIQLARELRDFASSSGETPLVEKADGWLARPGRSASDGAGLAAATHFAALDETAELWREAADRLSPVLVIDDLHRSDGASFRQAMFVCFEMRPCALRMLAAYRGAETEWTADLVPPLRSLESRCAVLDLGPLDIDSTREFATQIGVGTARDHVERLFRLSGGNPLFLSQLLAGPISQDTTNLPSNALGAAIDRVDRLPPQSRRALDVAAVLGQEVDLDLLAEVLGCDLASLSRDLEPAVDADLLRSPGPHGRITSFAHLLVRDAIYSAIEQRHRVQHHSAVASALERSDRSEIASALAHHFSEAIPACGPEPAMRYSAEAGLEAFARGAFSEAVAHCQRALALMREHSIGAELQAATLGNLAAAQMSAGNRGDARRTVLRAMDIAEQSGNWGVACQAALTVAPGVTSLEAGRVDEVALSVTRRALAQVPLSAKEERARLLARLAMALYWEPGSSEERRRLLQDASRAAAASGERSSKLFVEAFRIAALWQPGDVVERLNAATRLAAAAADASERQVEIVARIFRASTLAELGRRVEREREISRLEAVVKRPGTPESRWYPVLYRASIALDEGDWGAVERHSAEMARVGGPYGDANLIHSSGAMFVVTAYHQGRFNEAVPSITEIVDQFPGFVVWRAVRCRYAEQAGMDQLARNDYRGLAGGISFLSLDNVWLLTLTVLAEVCLAFSVTEDTPRFREALAPFSSQRPMAGYGVMTWGTVERIVGKLLAAEGDLEAAIARLESAAEAESQAQCPVWRAHTLVDSARVRLALGGRAQVDQALKELGEAEETAAGLGMAALGTSVADIRRRVAG